MSNLDSLENVTFDELTIGRSASIVKTLTKEDIELFSSVSGGIGPEFMHMAHEKKPLFHGILGHGMWSGTLISTVLGTLLPGPGTVLLEQDIKFRRGISIGDQVTTTVTVSGKFLDKPVAVLNCLCVNQKKETLIEGTVTVLVPTEKIKFLRPSGPDIDIHTHDRYRAIIEVCHKKDPIKVAVVQPVQGDVLQAVADAVQENLIIPFLMGPKKKILAAAEEAHVDISKWEVLDAEHSHAAAAMAAEWAANGKVDSIMKGSLHTDELLGAILPSTSGLRTERRISHVYVMDVANYHKPLIVTDAVVNIAPDLAAKEDICQNAINFWHALSPEGRLPRVAILAAVETVTQKMQATIDAAALCKMAERGQITGGIIDGPLAFDNAISKEAAAEKGIVSTVAGDADILVVPNIEAGNILAKQLTFLGRADAAGIVLGARVPVILTSRADNLRTRLLSCAMAVLLAEARRLGRFK